MNEPKPWANLVENFRAEATPTADAIDRGWQRVQTRLASGAPPPLEQTSTVGIGLKVTLTVLLVGSAVAVSMLAGRSRPLTLVGSTFAAADLRNASEPPPTPASAPVVEPPMSDLEPAVTSEPAPEAATKPTRRRPRARIPTANTPVDDTASLTAELTVLRQARAALRAGQAERALSLVATHRARYPDSAFDQERRLTKITALCALGRPQEAQRAADAFRRRFPSSSRGSEAMAGCRERVAVKKSD